MVFARHSLIRKPAVESSLDHSVDFIGKFESINDDFDQIKSIIGIEAELPHLNASKRAGYQSYYDDETRLIVAQWFHEDIEAFGYSF